MNAALTYETMREREKKDVRAVVMSTNVLREICFEIAMVTLKRKKDFAMKCTFHSVKITEIYFHTFIATFLLLTLPKS